MKYLSIILTREFNIHVEIFSACPPSVSNTVDTFKMIYCPFLKTNFPFTYILFPYSLNLCYHILHQFYSRIHLETFIKYLDSDLEKCTHGPSLLNCHGVPQVTSRALWGTLLYVIIHISKFQFIF